MTAYLFAGAGGGLLTFLLGRAVASFGTCHALCDPVFSATIGLVAGVLAVKMARS